MKRERGEKGWRKLLHGSGTSIPLTICPEVHSIRGILKVFIVLLGLGHLHSVLQGTGPEGLTAHHSQLQGLSSAHIPSSSIVKDYRQEGLFLSLHTECLPWLTLRLLRTWKFWPWFSTNNPLCSESMLSTHGGPSEERGAWGLGNENLW